MSNIFKKIPSAAYTVVSAVAVAAINYTIIHDPIAIILTLILLTHEFGHYITAKKHKADVKSPFFIPLPFLAVAVTRIKNLSVEGTKETAFNGPFFGAFATLVFLFFNLIHNFTSNTYLLFILIGEIVFNYFGSDGSKYRKAKRILQCRS